MVDPENEPPQRVPGSPVRPSDPVDDLQTGGPGRGRRRVVVGIDGSTESRAALHWAVDYAQQVDGEVHAIAVWHQPLQFGADAPSQVPDQQFQDEARAWLAAAMPSGTDAPTVEVETHIRQGEPATVLLDHALRADLLAVGNRGRSGLAGAMVGSVALRVAHHARCPVVLVPTPPDIDEQPPR